MSAISARIPSLPFAARRPLRTSEHAGPRVHAGFGGAAYQAAHGTSSGEAARPGSRAGRRASRDLYPLWPGMLRHPPSAWPGGGGASGRRAAPADTPPVEPPSRPGRPPVREPSALGAAPPRWPGARCARPARRGRSLPKPSEAQGLAAAPAGRREIARPGGCPPRSRRRPADVPEGPAALSGSLVRLGHLSEGSPRCAGRGGEAQFPGASLEAGAEGPRGVGLGGLSGLSPAARAGRAFGQAFPGTPRSTVRPANPGGPAGKGRRPVADAAARRAGPARRRVRGPQPALGRSTQAPARPAGPAGRWRIPAAQAAPRGRPSRSSGVAAARRAGGRVDADAAAARLAGRPVRPPAAARPAESPASTRPGKPLPRGSCGSRRPGMAPGGYPSQNPLAGKSSTSSIEAAPTSSMSSRSSPTATPPEGGIRPTASRNRSSSG